MQIFLHFVLKESFASNMLILSFIHPRVVPKLYESLSSVEQRWCFEVLVSFFHLKIFFCVQQKKETYRFGTALRRSKWWQFSFLGELLGKQNIHNFFLK